MPLWKGLAAEVHAFAAWDRMRASAHAADVSCHRAGFCGSDCSLADAVAGNRLHLEPLLLVSSFLTTPCLGATNALTELHPVLTVEPTPLALTANPVAGSSSVWSMRSSCRHTSPSVVARCPARSTTLTSPSRLASRRSTRFSRTILPRYAQKQHHTLLICLHVDTQDAQCLDHHAAAASCCGCSVCMMSCAG